MTGSTEIREITFRWSGREFSLAVLADETVSSLKRKIEEATRVQPKRQKLLGLKARNGRLPSDDDLLSELALKPGQKIMLMGAPEEVIEASDRQADAAPSIQDDFAELTEEDMKEVAARNWQADQEKIRKRLRNVEIPVLNAPRPGKKCLVLDIDYTIFDLGSSAERPEELARPYLLDMLTAVYPHYDLVIWSANSMKWIDVKMRELRVSNHPDFKLTCFLDGRCMVPVKTEKLGIFNCKPLSFLWGKFPDAYNERNTIMLDDLRRNFVYNKQNGLAIRPFRNAHATRATDRELQHLTLYLLKIARLPSLAGLRHSKWEHYIHAELKELRARERAAAAGGGGGGGGAGASSSSSSARQ